MFFCDTKVQKIHETTKYKDNKIVLKNDNYDRSTFGRLQGKNLDNFVDLWSKAALEIVSEKATSCRL